MLVKISDRFWIDFHEVYLILPSRKEVDGLEVHYRNSSGFTKVPLELVNTFLEKVHLHFGEDMKEVWGPTA